MRDLRELIKPPGFGCIYADPPWRFSNQGTRGATGVHVPSLNKKHTAFHYPTMSLEEIEALPIKELAAEHAHLHLWAPNAFLKPALAMFDTWGFTFKATFVWCKPQLGLGNYWRNSHELLLTGVRGNAKHFNDHSLRSWAEHPRTKHSVKPPEIHELLQRASPGPYLELFARTPYPNWVTWGAELSDAQL